MATPTLVGSISGSFHAGSGTLTYSSTLGNDLLVGITLADGTDSVSGIIDNLGNNINGYQVNQWQYLGSTNLGSSRLEVWTCLRAKAITSLTISFTSGGTATQYVTAILAEYSNGSGVSTYGALQVNSAQNTPSTYNTGHNQKYMNQHTQINLTIEQPPPSGACTIIGFFSNIVSNLPGDTQAFALATSGTKQVDVNQLTANYPNLCLLDNSVAGSDGELSVGVNQDSYIESGDPLDYNYLSVSSLQGFYIVLTDTLILTHEPGFSDLADSNLAAGQQARGLDLIKISENGAFGMCRMEFFYGEYSNGQTVDLPVSPIDGYEYQRDELTYIWNVRSTVNPSSGWASGQEAIWIANWYVQQSTGVVFTEEWYSWVHADHPPIQSSDGILGVYTVAQRQQANLTLSVAAPQYTDVNDGDFAAQAAYRTDILTGMNDNSKLAAVSKECIYMGEFVNGDTVPQPVSPADGYVYPYGQCAMVCSLRWNTSGGAYTQPTNDSFLNNFTASVTGGAVSITVQTWDPGNGVLTVSGAGRVAVFALCNRQEQATFYTNPALSGSTHTGTPPFEQFSYHLNAWAGFTGTQVRFQITGTGTSISIDWYNDAQNSVIQSNTYPLIGGETALISPPASKNFNVTAVGGGTYVSGVVNIYVQGALAFTSLANQFKEVDPTQLLPGNPIPFGTLKQINDNIREAIVSVEFFGPTNYTNGQTVSLPTSLVDGYAYSRGELFYIAVWEALNATTQVRIIVGEGYVNATTGVVSTTIFELPSGGTGTSEADGTLSVVTVGIRSGSGRTSGATSTTINQGQIGSDSGS
jgi:hypothetical protein